MDSVELEKTEIVKMIKPKRKRLLSSAEVVRFGVFDITANLGTSYILVLLESTQYE